MPYQSLLIFFIVLGILYGIGYIISMLRDPQSIVKTKPSHLVEFRAPFSSHDVRRVVTNFARQMRNLLTF